LAEELARPGDNIHIHLPVAVNTPCVLVVLDIAEGQECICLAMKWLGLLREA
jgi:hypothetical protein